MFNPYEQLSFIGPPKRATKPIVLAVFESTAPEVTGLISRLVQENLTISLIFASLDSHQSVGRVAQQFPDQAFACDKEQCLAGFLERNPCLESIFQVYILEEYKVVWKGAYPSTDFDYWVTRVSSQFKTFATPSSECLGPYSPGVVGGGFLFVSGQLGMLRGSLVKGVAEETKQAIKNAENLLREQNSNLENVCKTTVYLQNMDDFEEMNKAYKEFFSKTKPARICCEISRLPAGALVEIDFIAIQK